MSRTDPRPEADLEEDDEATGPSRWRTGWDAYRRWPLPARAASYVAIALVLFLLASLATVVVLVRRPFPQTTGTLDLPGLSAPVTVVRDDHGIPQLYGDSVDDLMRAQGYVSAQERFFEMDVRRHITAGRLSELFGKATLRTDEFVRTLGWRRVAERELALVSPETRTALQDYADGVNAYLDQRTPSQMAVEYSILGASGLDYSPEPWTPVDSLAWLKAMAWDLRGNMTDEIDRVMDLSRHTPAQVRELYPPYDAQARRPILTQGAVVDGVFDQDATRSGTRNPQRPAPYDGRARAELRRLRDGLARLPQMLGHGDALGSNSWVVDGAHSTTGKPLLANDPHLGVSLPGIWLQMGLHCRQVSASCPLDVAGFTFSGVPGVIIGHNADIAWGFTNLGPDVSDLYLERVRGDRWRYDGQWRPLRQRREVIRVRGESDVTITVRSTKHGPLLSDVDDQIADVGTSSLTSHEPARPYGVSLEWTALRPGRTADAILQLDQATGWTSFREAASHFEVPAQNMVYADRAGHIGYQAPGLIPIRKSGNDGTLPAEGWRPSDDWSGSYVPFSALPHALDPEGGVVVTANQEVIGDDYPYFLTRDWDQGYRSQRISDLIAAQGKLSVDDMTRIQLDSRNPMAPTLVPYLLDVRLPRGYPSAGQDLLRHWDLTQPADSAAAAYYNVVWRDLLALTFHDDLDEDQWPDGGDRWMAVMSHLLRKPHDAWWDDRDTPERETRDDILRQALLDARDDLTALEARSPHEWTWGGIHRLYLRNQTLGESGVGLVERMVNRGPWDVPGGDAIVDAAAWDAASGSFEVTSAPSMRMVVDLSDWDHSRWINLTGASGHPYSAHYTDQTDLWARGETLPWLFSGAAVQGAGEDVLTLQPAAEDSGD